jgi:hypothetical protein
MPHVRFSRVTSRADVEEKDDCEARVGDDVGTTISSDDVYPWRHNSIDEVKRAMALRDQSVSPDV